MIALYDALGFARAHFVGLSMGGMTGIALTKKHRERVDRLVACDCGPASTPQSAQQWSERIAMAVDRGMQALVQPTIDRWFPEEFIAANPSREDQSDDCHNAGQWVCRLRVCTSDFDLRPGLASIDQPVQFICSGRDAALPGTKTLHAGIPNAKFFEISGAGHIANLEQPALFSKVLRNFLGSTNASGVAS